MKKHKLSAMIVLILIVSFLLGACGSSTPEQKTTTLTIALTTDVPTLEFPYTPERQAANASATLFDSLAFPEKDGTFSPALAERWDVSADGTTYTFHLRKDVKFHNGEDFTADDVVYSWETYSNDEVPYAYTFTIAESVIKVDDYTVEISTSEPNALLLPYIATYWVIIPADYHKQSGLEGFAAKPVGTGPFMLEEWIKGDHVTVAKNPSYWRVGYPKLDKVLFKIMPEAATRVAAIQAGEIDIAPRLTSDDIKSLDGSNEINVINYPINRAYYVAFNNLTTGKGQPTEDARVRQAMAHAVDVQTIIDSLLGGNATPAIGLVAESNLGFEKADMVKYDPEKTKQLLSEAGYPDGFQMDMACPDAAFPHINEVCQAVREYFNQVGITGELNFMEANAFWDQQAEKQLPPLFIDSWSSEMSDAFERLQGTLGQDESYAQWYNEDLANLLTQISVTADGTARAKLYVELQKMMREDPPFVYLYYPQTFEGVRSHVQNYQPRPAEEYYLWDVVVSDN